MIEVKGQGAGRNTNLGRCNKNLRQVGPTWKQQEPADWRGGYIPNLRYFLFQFLNLVWCIFDSYLFIWKKGQVYINDFLWLVVVSPQGSIWEILNDIFVARMIRRHYWYLVGGIINVLHKAVSHSKYVSCSLQKF